MSDVSSVSELNAPQLDSEVGSHVPAITSVEQAIALVSRLRSDFEVQERRNAQIADLYNAARPYDPERLRADGLAWKTNFSSKALASVVDRVVPRYVSLIRGLRYLTAVEFPPDVPNAAAKTERVRRAITRTVRSHPLWEEFLESVVQEMVLYGYAVVAWPWLTDWFPRFYPQGEALVWAGTPHNAQLAPVLCLRQTFLRHELLMHVQDRAAAEKMGWDVEAVIEALNQASPLTVGEATVARPTRSWSELVREGSVVASYLGAPVVSAWHVFVAEVDGRVTHVLYDERTRKPLLWREKYFEHMGQVAAFFSYQHGTGKLMTSKGLGRELYNIARTLDRVRCEVVDRFNLSGKVWFHVEPKDLPKFRMSVYGNAVLVGSAYPPLPTRPESGVNAYLPLDEFLSSLMEQIAGATTPRQFRGERVSRAEVELYAAREEERRDALFERFLTQFAAFMTTLQQRLLFPWTTDSRAQALQRELQTFLSEEELAYLRQATTMTAVRDYTESQRLAMVQLAAEVRGNPLYRQREVERQRLIAQFGPELADQLLVPEEDATIVAEQVRLQQMELQVLRSNSGASVPVSPRDAHGIHLGVLQETLAREAAELGNQEDMSLVVLQWVAILQHAAAHLEAAEAAGQSADVQGYRQWFQQFEADLRKLLAKVQASADTASAGLASSSPSPLSGSGAPSSTSGAQGFGSLSSEASGPPGHAVAVE